MFDEDTKMISVLSWNFYEACGINRILRVLERIKYRRLNFNNSYDRRVYHLGHTNANEGFAILPSFSFWVFMLSYQVSLTGVHAPARIWLVYPYEPDVKHICRG